MSERHNEAAFEAAIEAYLTTSGGYVTGDREAFDAEGSGNGVSSRIVTSTLG